MTAKTESIPETAKNTTREHLIATGLDLMRRYGYGATGLQEILKSADVPKGSFYHHFSSKEEFAAAALQRYVDIAEEFGGTILGNTKQAPLKRLRHYFQQLIQMAGQASPVPGCLMGNLTLETANASRVLQQVISAGFTTWQNAVAGVLREAIESGDLPKSTKPEVLAGFILNSWEGALLRSQADKSDAPLKDFLHFIFDELLAR